jgi:sulfate transport system substrate-binding protein
LQGLKADVVTYNQVTDVQILHDKGNLIPADWQSRLPNNSSPFYSTMGFLVRKGNPKNIHDWNDLVRSDVKLIFPNRKPPVTRVIPIWRRGARRTRLTAAIKPKPSSS